MKYLMLTAILLLPFALFAQHTLTVRVSGIESAKGKLDIGIFTSAGQFLKEGKAYKTNQVKVNGNTATITISGLPTGTYAFSLYHDANNDGKCNRNMVGIPTEGYAFSNNIKPKLSAPSFASCSFKMTGSKSVNISMIN